MGRGDELSRLIPIYTESARRDVADDVGGLICPLEFRYGRAEFKSLFTRAARLRRALEVEAALAESEADAGLIPDDAARAIRGAVKRRSVQLARVDELDRELHHDVMAIARALAEKSAAGGAYVHYGATSADITDTALALELREAGQILRDDLTALIRVLLELARKHRATAEVGRTHGQHAVPMSFGYKVAVGAAEFLRHRQRWDELQPRLAVGKMSGAVGTGASFGARAEEIEAGVMRRLGLSADEAPTQIVGRDRIAELTNWLALVAGTSERLATEVRNLQRTELAEVAEAFDERRQVGSSTMAQKRNPVVSENVASLARLIRALALPPLENMVLWHERDLTNSANERVVLPHALVLTDDVLTKLTEVFRGLVVLPKQMAENLGRSEGSVMTENLLLALTAKGVPRAEAHELLRTLTGPGAGKGSLAEKARRNAGISQHLKADEITSLLDPKAYVEAAARKTDRVVARLERELEP